MEVDPSLMLIVQMHLFLGILSIVLALLLEYFNDGQLWVMGILCVLSGIAIAISLIYGFPI
jgi:hypothetical protein